MKKRQIHLVAAGLIGALALSACGGAASGQAQTSSSSSSASSASSSEETEAASSGSSSTASSSSTSETAEEEMTYTASADPILQIPTVAGDYKIAEVVKLGEYKGLDLEMTVEEVSDEDVDTYIGYLLTPEEITDESATVKEGDTVNLDFVGKKDGVAFEGGTGEGYDLEIGSGSFIPGFEDGMIGMKKGETKDLDLTFPEDYFSEDLAGAKVVFTVTVNYISQVPELSDEWVAKYSEGAYSTVEEFRAANREELEESNRSYAEAMAMSEAWQKVVDSTEILAFPEAVLSDLAKDYDEYMEGEAELYEKSLEDYVSEMGMDMAQYKEMRDTQVRYEARERLILEALVDAEGVTEEDPEYVEQVSKLEEDYMMTREELEENYGSDVIQDYIFSNIVQGRILSYANIKTTETPDEEETESSSSEAAESSSSETAESSSSETAASSSSSAE